MGVLLYELISSIQVHERRSGFVYIQSDPYTTDINVFLKKMFSHKPWKASIMSRHSSLCKTLSILSRIFCTVKSQDLVRGITIAWFREGCLIMIVSKSSTWISCLANRSENIRWSRSLISTSRLPRNWSSNLTLYVNSVAANLAKVRVPVCVAPPRPFSTFWNK